MNISSYSEEQKTDYYSQYRQVDKEIRIIKEQGFSNVLLTDIYPKEANRWENTHFYAITAELSV